MLMVLNIEIVTTVVVGRSNVSSGNKPVVDIVSELVSALSVIGGAPPTGNEFSSSVSQSGKPYFC